MKKTISIILLISMLLSMMLVPSSALSDEEINVAQGISSPWRWSMKGGKRDRTPLAFDGVKSHSYCDGNQKICIQPQGYPTATYDINGLQKGKNLNEIEYMGIVGWPLPNGKAVVDTIRVYLNDIHEDGSSCKWMPDALDIAVSPTGAAGSWQIVYSEDNIRCEQKFGVYEEAGKKTAYIEATFPATEVSHFQIALRVARCPHMADSAAVTNAVGKCTIRITEIEVMGYQAFNPSNYTNILAGASVDSYQFDTAAGFDNATDGVVSHNHDDNTSYLNLATKTYTKEGTYDINGQPGSDYVGYVTYKMRAFEEIEAVRVYLDEIRPIELCALSLDGGPDLEACDRMLDGMDIAISKTGKPGSWQIVYSEDNINCEKKYLIHEDEEGNLTAYVEALFDPTKASYIRIGITDTGCEEHTGSNDALRSCRITEVEAWTGARVSLDGEEGEDTGINSLMLIPLLMRHRQYETEDSTAMFGLRVKNLLRKGDSITFEKNDVKAEVPAAALTALGLKGSQKLVVTMTRPSEQSVKLVVKANGEAVSALEGTLITMPWAGEATELKAVDGQGNAMGATYDAASKTVSFIANAPGTYVVQEGTAPDAPVIVPTEPAEPEIEGTVYRWDFNDLNEANGANNLTDSAKSAKEYTFENGCIVLPGRDTDFKLAQPISLGRWNDWSIEWRAQLTQNSALFGAETSNQNFIYIAYTVSGWGLPFRMVSSNNKAAMVRMGDYAALHTEMNTWKAEYNSDEGTLTLKYYNEDNQDWEVVGTTSPSDVSYELTHMFGRYADTNVCLSGQVDYIEVFVGE